MRDYVKMFILSETPEYYTLVSEGLPPTEIEGFAEVFNHNYGGEVTVCNKPKSDLADCIVIAEKVPIRLIRGNYDRKIGCFIVATWRYATRGDNLKRLK